MRKFFLVLAILTSMAEPVFPQLKNMMGGIYGRNISSVKVVGDRFIAGTEKGGIFISTDKGDSWIEKKTCLKEYNVTSIAVCGNKVFAGTNLDGLYVSTDMGETWTQNQAGKSVNYIKSLDACNNIIVAVTDFGNFYISTDTGESWSLKGEAITCKFGRCYVKEAGVKGNCIYVHTSDNEVFISSDMGESWTRMGKDFKLMQFLLDKNTLFKNNALEDSVPDYLANIGESRTEKSDIPGDGPVRTVAVDNNVIALATYEKDLFVSTDEGKTWSKKNKGFEKQDIAALAVLGNTIVAANYERGLMVSHDLGESWIRKNNNIMCRNIASVAVCRDSVYACTDEGIWLTTDSGGSWAQKRVGNSYMNVYNLSISGSNFAAVTDSGVYISTDMGDNWSKIIDIPDEDSWINELTTIMIEGKKIVMLDNDTLLVSENLGRNWKKSVVVDFYGNGFEGFAVSRKSIYFYTLDNSIYRLPGPGNRLKLIVQGAGGDHPITGLIPCRDICVYSLYEAGLWYAYDGKAENDVWICKDMDFNSLTMEGNELYAVTTDNRIFHADIRDMIVPKIEQLANMAGYANEALTQDFVVHGYDQDSFKLSVQSSNQKLLPESNIRISGKGINRRLKLKPVKGQTGISMISVTLTDGIHSDKKDFVLRVHPKF